ncbi:MAG: NADH-quinone oxidoreductase subunit L [Actinomycetota bacterium]|nr:NADH-quinone oxidoreductase subunit L [Actinomycetota bacterium]
MEHVLHPAPGSVIDLAWLLPIVPALSAALLMIFGKRIAKAAGAVAVFAAAFSAIFATLIFYDLWWWQPPEARVFERTISPWISAGSLHVDWGLLIDPLATIMLLLVTWVGLLLHIYSLGYMAGDERYHLFFAYMNLFLASMIILVTGANFLVLFVGWELVGLCSYLLIGFWFEKRAYASAAKKAFVVNRIGDVGFLIAMLVIFATFGTLKLPDVLRDADTVLGPESFTAAAIGLLLLAGATGKSAQIPLYVWLPDAMVGPTPVSALIHAATMVTAGVYLIARTSPIYALVPNLGLFVAWIGVLTALMAALIACTQRDAKRILAYSTISQLGYMFIGVGVGNYTAGIFHLLTHGFFKALLFLCAGSVMHALAEETDIRRMGGLWRPMPLTAGTAAVAWLAISGVPWLSGFYSKEEILQSATTWDSLGIWTIGIVTAILTAFYMSRWFFLIFLGPARWPDGADPHESPPSMALPMVALAVGSALGGWINIDPKKGFLHGWLEHSVVLFVPGHELIPPSTGKLAAIVASLLGIAVAFAMYLRPGVDVPALRERAGGLYGVLLNRFYVDELYQSTIALPGRLMAEGLATFDDRGIDGAVNGVARFTAGLATAGRRLQTGFVRSYALAVLAGAVLLTVLLVGGVAWGR